MEKRVLSFFLVVALVAGIFAGCGRTDGRERETFGTKEEIPLVAGYAQFSGKFSPFFYESAYDRDAVDMTQIYLIETDRAGNIINNGIEGQTTAYNGTDYTYYSASDVKVEIDAITGDTIYTIHMRDDIKFSDGEQANIDDVIFSLYVLCDTDYDGAATVYSAPIKGMEEYRGSTAAGTGGRTPNISGITRVDDFTLQVETDGYDATTIYKLAVCIAPLHYYGEESLYDYDNNSFGFTRGDLSKVREKTTMPMGAGPYVFEKYKNKTIYYTANEHYYKGMPKIENVQFKETPESEKVTAVEQGMVDISEPLGSKSTFEQIADINGNGEMNGAGIVTSTVDNLGYGYLGANASTVNVGGVPDSEASKNLRKAFMTIFAVYREVNINSYYGDAANVINYPISNTSWAAPQEWEAGYETAYSQDINGDSIYTEEMSIEEKYEAAKKASLGFFEAAGYTVKNGKVIEAPEGASMEYEVIIPAEGRQNHPAFGILTDAKAALETMGITLDINNPGDSNVLWQTLDAGTQNFWIAAWSAAVDPDIYQIYHSSNIDGGSDFNYYHIADTELDEQIMKARTNEEQEYRKKEYRKCLDKILQWGVELPIYQRQNCIIYSPQRINADTMTKDITPFYSWLSEIENIEMNK